MRHFRQDTPWLPFDAIVWLDAVVNENMRVFEWGSGGSTIFLAQRCQSVMSVEIDASWVERTMSRAEELGLDNVQVLHIAPSDPYYSSVLALQPQKFDLIFIDGKERLRCAEAAIKKIAKGGIILFDNSDAAAHKDDVVPLRATGWPETYIEGDGVGGHWAASAWRVP